MNINLKGELTIMDSMNLKPNYAALGRKYGMDYRTVKKYHNGYEGRPKTRNKKSKLDYYRTEIVDKLKIKRLTVKGVKKYGILQNSIMKFYSEYQQYFKHRRMQIMVEERICIIGYSPEKMK